MAAVELYRLEAGLGLAGADWSDWLAARSEPVFLSSL